MINKTVDYQATEYVYDLNNCAKEYGFKADEGWEFSMANDEDKRRLEKQYYPTITAKVLPEILSELFNKVKSKLIQARADLERKFDQNDKPDTNLRYLIAYNPKRMR